MELVAKRSMTYATRRLLPGDRFTAPNSDARVLVAIKKAEVFEVPVASDGNGDDSEEDTD